MIALFRCGDHGVEFVKVFLVVAVFALCQAVEAGHGLVESMRDVHFVSEPSHFRFYSFRSAMLSAFAEKML
jgi:hypothetical protein